jgi:cytosine/adenosine deaminase-related metal-dependent hydrolase
MLAPGYRADLAIFAGDPLDPATPVAMTFSAGEVTHETPLAERPQPTKVMAAVPEAELPQALPSAYAIRSARLLGADGNFAPGSVVVRDGKIEAVHAADAELAELPIYDVGDAVVTPGLVTAHATLNPAAVRDSQGVVDSGSLRAADTFDPDAAAVKELSAGGFLRAGHAPDDARVIAGPLAEVRLGAADPIVAPQIAEKIVFSNEARSRERFPASLAGQQQLLRESLAAKEAPLPLYLPRAALAVLDDARDERRQALSRGERPMLIRAETDAEVVAVLKLVKELGIRATLLGPDELRATAPMLGAAGIGIVSRPLRASDFDWFTADLASAIEAGASLGFAGADPLEIRRTAAALIQRGVSPQTVLVGLTQGGARLVGMSEGAGALRAGQPADLVLWSGSPLELTARPLAVVVDGKRLPTDK